MKSLRTIVRGRGRGQIFEAEAELGLEDLTSLNLMSMNIWIMCVLPVISTY